MTALGRGQHANCSICCQIYIKPVVLPCGHTFCDNCLSKWFDRRRACPQCRKKVPAGYLPIQLIGWEDTLESLALLLPEEEQEERRAAKRLREEEGEQSLPVKRNRTLNNHERNPLTGGEYAALSDDDDDDPFQSLPVLPYLIQPDEEYEAQSEAAEYSEWEQDYLGEADDYLEDQESDNTNVVLDGDVTYDSMENISFHYQSVNPAATSWRTTLTDTLLDQIQLGLEELSLTSCQSLELDETDVFDDEEDMDYL